MAAGEKGKGRWGDSCCKTMVRMVAGVMISAPLTVATIHSVKHARIPAAIRRNGFAEPVSCHHLGQVYSCCSPHRRGNFPLK